MAQTPRKLVGTSSALKLPSPSTPSRPCSSHLQPSPFHRYCMLSLSPLSTSQVPSASYSPSTPFFPRLSARSIPSRTIKKLDFSVNSSYQLKVQHISVQVKLINDDPVNFQKRCQNLFSPPAKNSLQNSQFGCLKILSGCFDSDEYFVECNCLKCMKKIEWEEAKNKAIKSAQERELDAFQSQLIRGKQKKLFSASLLKSTYIRGCNCKKTACLKKYCECFRNGARCDRDCRCIGCKNME